MAERLGHAHVWSFVRCDRGPQRLGDGFRPLTAEAAAGRFVAVQLARRAARSVARSARSSVWLLFPQLGGAVRAWRLAQAVGLGARSDCSAGAQPGCWSLSTVRLRVWSPVRSLAWTRVGLLAWSPVTLLARSPVPLLCLRDGLGLKPLSDGVVGALS